MTPTFGSVENPKLNFLAQLRFYLRALSQLKNKVRFSACVSHAERNIGIENIIIEAGKWNYLYRAVDKKSNTAAFLIARKHTRNVTKCIFDRTIIAHGTPEKVTLDKSESNKSALSLINLILALFSRVCSVLFKTLMRDIKYLNDIIKQDHRGIKRITKPILRFKSFDAADATITGIECPAY